MIEGLDKVRITWDHDILPVIQHRTARPIERPVDKDTAVYDGKPTMTCVCEK